MKTTVEIEYAKLKAANLFSAKYDIRQYLNAVCLEVGSKQSVLMASDGSIGAIIKLGCCAEGLAELIQVIIPNDLIDKIKTKSEMVAISIGEPGHDFSDVELTISGYDGTSIVGRSIRVKYPDLRRVFPSSQPSGEPAQFQPYVIELFAKASVMLGRKKTNPCVSISYNGEGASLISVGRDDFVGVAMPLRKEHKGVVPPLTEVPAWVNEDLCTAPKEIGN